VLIAYGFPLNDGLAGEFVLVDRVSPKTMESETLSNAFGRLTGFIGPQVRRVFNGGGGAPSDFMNQYGTPGIGGGFQGVPMFQASSGPLPTFIPAINIMERYDTNVFNLPKTPGLVRDDFVTTISPQLMIMPNPTGLVTGRAQVGAVGEIYAKNPGLNYVGGNVGGMLDLSRLVQQAIPRLTLLVSNTFSYTPQPPAFLGGGAVNASGEPASQDLADSYARGLQVQRVNTLSNTASAISTYALTPSIYMYGNATYVVQRFGSIPDNQQRVVPLLSSDTQHYTIGPEFRFSTNETVRTLFIYSRTDFIGAQDRGDVIRSFEAMGGRVSYSRPLFTPAANGFATVEVQQVKPGNRLQYTGSLGVTWTRNTDLFALSYTRRISPSYVGAAGGITSDLIGIAVSRRFSDFWSGSAQAAYAHNKAIEETTAAGGPRDFSFNSYTVGTALSYQLMVGLSLTGSYTYMYFDSEGLSPSAGFTGESIAFDRHMAVIQLRKVWF
jgi:hypothetical protein